MGTPNWWRCLSVGDGQVEGGPAQPRERGAGQHPPLVEGGGVGVEGDPALGEDPALTGVEGAVGDGGGGMVVRGDAGRRCVDGDQVVTVEGEDDVGDRTGRDELGPPVARRPEGDGGDGLPADQVGQSGMVGVEPGQQTGGDEMLHDRSGSHRPPSLLGDDGEDAQAGVASTKGGGHAHSRDAGLDQRGPQGGGVAGLLAGADELGRHLPPEQAARQLSGRLLIGAEGEVHAGPS